jgi:hypothetical protein
MTDKKSPVYFIIVPLIVSIMGFLAVYWRIFEDIDLDFLP